MYNFRILQQETNEIQNSEHNVHDRLKHLSVPELQQLSQDDRKPFHVCCFNLTGDLNVGTIIRTAHLLGAKSVIVFGRTRFDKRSLVGAANYIRVERVEGLTTDLEFDANIFHKTMNDKKLIPIPCELNGKNLYTIDWKIQFQKIYDYEMEPCLVLGNETYGLSEEIIKICLTLGGFVVSIPQFGVIRSFNVSSAFSIIGSQIIGAMQWY